ncbi:MAG: hypothetical protein KDA20_07480 [Phycisphaerales bacterium]|nr:hypothetical protein [Phycisphaerales bacterium]
MRSFWKSLGGLVVLLTLAASVVHAQRAGIGAVDVGEHAQGPAQGEVTAGALTAPLFHNLPTVLAPAKAKLAAGGTVSILVLGDSLSFKQPGAWTPFFRNMMQNEYGDAGEGYQGFSVWTGAGFNNGWTTGQANHDTVPHHAPDGLWAESDGQGAEAGTGSFFARDVSIKLHYVEAPGGRVIQIEHPWGVPIASIDCNGATAALRTWRWTFAPEEEDRLIWFRPMSAGTGLILGQVNTTGVPGVLVHRAANGGWGVDEFLQRDWTFDAQVADIAPDLVFIWLGQNDQNYSSIGYRASLAQLIERLQNASPGAQFVLIGTYDSGSTFLEPIVSAMEVLADESGFGFIDLYHSAGAYQFFVDSGYLYDGLHFSISGGQYVARIIFDAFQTDGWSMYVACDGDTDGDGVRGLNDLAALLQQFGTPTSYSAVDMDHDGDVDLTDLAGLLQVFGTPCIPPRIVPPIDLNGSGAPTDELNFDSWDPTHPIRQ